MKHLRYLNAVLTVIAVLLTLNLYAMWTLGPATTPSFANASAKPFPQPEQQAVDQLKRINKALDSLDKTLTSETFKVTVENLPEESD